jgi:deoxyribose-phosphate aldolase
MEIEKIVEQVAQEVLKQLGGEAKPCISPAIHTYPGEDVAGVIEHSVTNPDTTEEQVIKACKEARKYRFANVCVFPYFVPLAAELLAGSGIAVCTPVAFPHGGWMADTKLIEAKEAVKCGATELDVAVNLSAIKSGKYEEALNELAAIVSAVQGKAKVKAIYEQGSYTDEEKIKVLNLACRSGADFIKIQNFLSGKKAAPEDVAFVRSIIGKGMGIKIDGGVSDAGTVRKLLAAGATRVGCSKSVKIVRGE